MRPLTPPGGWGQHQNSILLPFDRGSVVDRVAYRLVSSFKNIEDILVIFQVITLFNEFLGLSFFFYQLLTGPSALIVKQVSDS